MQRQSRQHFGWQGQQGDVICLYCGLAVVWIGVVGCHSAPRLPTRATPAEAAQAAMEKYDQNGDDMLDAGELDACPSLKMAARRMFASGTITQEAIAERIRLHGTQSDFVAMTIMIYRNNVGLAGASVVFEPEDFMGTGFPRYAGDTDGQGTVLIKSADNNLAGMLPPGFYRVRITQPDGTEVVRGCEIADDIPSANRISFSI